MVMMWFWRVFDCAPWSETNAGDFVRYFVSKFSHMACSSSRFYLFVYICLQTALRVVSVGCWWLDSCGINIEMIHHCISLQVISALKALCKKWEGKERVSNSIYKLRLSECPRNDMHFELI